MRKGCQITVYPRIFEHFFNTRGSSPADKLLLHERGGSLNKGLIYLLLLIKSSPREGAVLPFHVINWPGSDPSLCFGLSGNSTWDAITCITPQCPRRLRLQQQFKS